MEFCQSEKVGTLGFAWHKYYLSDVSSLSVLVIFPIIHLLFILYLYIIIYPSKCKLNALKIKVPEKVGTCIFDM